MEWKISDLKILEPVKAIREKPHMYFLNGTVSHGDLIGRVSDDILAIPQAKMIVFYVNDWCVIGGDKEWIPVSEKRSIPDHFFRIVTTPDREFRSMRSEVFLTAVSKDLVFFLPDCHLVIQGEITQALLQGIYPMIPWQQMVAFRLSPEYKSEPQ